LATQVTPITNLDMPEFVVPPENRVQVNDYPAHQMPIPPSRMFLIRDALQKYKAVAGENAPTFDASQGDGGASLPGVPVDILQRALELQIKMGTAYNQPWGHGAVPQSRRRAVLASGHRDRLGHRKRGFIAG
jgi:hypothetical protein